MASTNNYTDIPAPGRRLVRITQAEADALRVALTKAQALDERQRHVLRCVLHEWRSGVAWKFERHSRGKPGLGLRPMVEVVLRSGPLHGVRASMEAPEDCLCGRHGLLRRDARSDKLVDAAPPGCLAYVRDPHAHPNDASVVYSFAPDLSDEVRKGCAIGKALPPVATEDDWLDV